MRAIDTAPGHVSVGDVVKLASGHFVKVIAPHPETAWCGHVIVPASVVPAQDSEALSRSLGTSLLSRQPAEKSTEFHPLVRAADTTVKNSCKEKIAEWDDANPHMACSRDSLDEPQTFIINNIKGVI